MESINRVHNNDISGNYDTLVQLPFWRSFDIASWSLEEKL